ncbi:MAG: hypothetical protein QNJ37_22660 [Crocosphaera sp.]|nr:hypothetical protein [Crocosphaera sp.]
MHCLNKEQYPLQCLELSEIKTIEILRNKGLQDEDCWLELIQLYEGNPAYLNDIAMLIKDIFGGKVTDFLQENNLLITKKMQFQLKQIFDRCSNIEQKIGLELSQANRALPREELTKNLSLSSSDLINGLQSLQQRYLVKKIEEDQILFTLSPVFKEYLKTDCKNSIQ